MKGSTFLDFFPKLRQHAPQDDTLEASTFPASIGGGRVTGHPFCHC